MVVQSGLELCLVVLFGRPSLSMARCMPARHCLCCVVGSNSMYVGGLLGGARTSLRKAVCNERLVITTVTRALFESGIGGQCIGVDGATCDCEAAQFATSRGASILVHATPLVHRAANSRSFMSTAWKSGHGARFGFSPSVLEALGGGSLLWGRRCTLGSRKKASAHGAICVPC